MRSIAAIGSIKRLNISNCASVGNQGIAELRPLASTLDTLDMVGLDKVNAEGFRCLNGFASLTHLDASFTSSVTDAEAEAIASIASPRLATLFLEDFGGLTTSGMVAICGITSLKWLRLIGLPDVEGPGIAAISKLSELRRLTLSRSTLGGHIGALLRCTSLCHLWELNLHGCSDLTDSDLEGLTLPALWMLDVSGSAVSPAVHLATAG